MEKIRIALADDHTLLRKTIISMLSEDDAFEVIADATNGSELIRIIDGIKIPPDVCLLDINMPVMDGHDTLMALKQAYADMKFLMLSQYDHGFVIIKMLKAGANGYLLKDCEPAELKEAIKEVVEQPYYSSKLVNGHLNALIQKGKSLTKLSLSEREQEFLKLCCSELAYKEIAAKMNITDRTTAFYRQSLFTKLNVISRTGLALYAIKLGMMPARE